MLLNGRIMMKFFLNNLFVVLLIVSVFLFLPAIGSANLIQNGGFETPTADGILPVTYLPNWNIVRGDIEVIGSNHWQPYESAQSIDLSGCSRGTISQRILNTDPSKTYTLSFALSGNPDPGATSGKIRKLVVYWDDDPARIYSFDTSVITSQWSDMKWRKITIPGLKATTTSTILKFKDISPNTEPCVGVALDDVIVIENKPTIKIRNAQMVSNKVLGIGIQHTYPDNLPKNTKKYVTFTATINGKTIPPQTFDVTNLQYSDMYDSTGNLLPSTPLFIDLEKQNVPRFTDNVQFTLTGTSTYAGGPESDPATRDVKILLPVVVLPGYIDILRKEETKLPADLLIKGYPFGITNAPSDNPNLNIGIALRQKMFTIAYKPLSDTLVKQGYVKMKNVAPGMMYVTLWDPEDRYIGYSSVSYATAQDIYVDINNIYNQVKAWSYADKMNIIGHSTGGLAARYYASRTDGKTVNKVITVGTPHDGIARFNQQPFGYTYLQRLTKTEYFLYTGRQNFINRELVVPGTTTQNTLQWFVPRWEGNLSVVEKLDPSDPNPYFTNTFNYPFNPKTKYYLIYGNYAATPTPYSVKIRKGINSKWYDHVSISYGRGDGYVFIMSASDSVHKTGQTGATIKRQGIPSLTQGHATLLLDRNVQICIISDLK